MAGTACYPSSMTERESIPTLVAYGVQKDTLVMADNPPVDDDGLFYRGDIPAERVETCPHRDPEDDRRCMDCEPA